LNSVADGKTLWRDQAQIAVGGYQQMTERGTRPRDTTVLASTSP
jgi:hypothetical protein